MQLFGFVDCKDVFAAEELQIIEKFFEMKVSLCRVIAITELDRIQSLS